MESNVIVNISFGPDTECPSEILRINKTSPGSKTSDRCHRVRIHQLKAPAMEGLLERELIV